MGKLQFAGWQKEFLTHCATERALSENTLLAYEQDVECFNRFCCLNNQDVTWNRAHVFAYLKYLREVKELSPATVRRRILTVKTFTKRLSSSGAIDNCPFEGLELDIPIPRRLPRPVERSMVAQLVRPKAESVRDSMGAEATQRQSTISTTDVHETTVLAIKLMVATGIRVGELTQIRLCDIFDAGRKVRIKGKGNRERVVYVANAELREAISSYLGVRSASGIGADHFLLNRNGRRLSEQAIRCRLRSLSRKVGSQVPITPHQFRHSSATFLVEEGVDIRVVQRLLGHSGIATTELYTQVSDVSLMLALQGADPLSRLNKETS